MHLKVRGQLAAEQRATGRSVGNGRAAGDLQPFVEQEATFAEFTQDLVVRGEIRRRPCSSILCGYYPILPRIIPQKPRDFK